MCYSICLFFCSGRFGSLQLTAKRMAPTWLHRRLVWGIPELAGHDDGDNDHYQFPSVAPSFFHTCVTSGKTARMEDVERFKVKETDMASPIFSLPFSNEIFCRDFLAWQPKKFKTGRIQTTSISYPSLCINSPPLFPVWFCVWCKRPSSCKLRPRQLESITVSWLKLCPDSDSVNFEGSKYVKDTAPYIHIYRLACKICGTALTWSCLELMEPHTHTDAICRTGTLVRLARE